MEKIIDGVKYILKEYLTAREENYTGVTSILSKLLDNFSKSEDEDIIKEMMKEIVFSDSFNEIGVRMIESMLIEPKKSKSEVLDLESTTVLALKLDCLMLYAKSFKKIENLFKDNKKKSLI